MQSIKTFVKDRLTWLFTAQLKQIIKNHNPIVIAVVGSVGKTSTKSALKTILSEKYRVLAQDGNYNTPISVPFIFFERSLPTLHNPFGWLAAWLAGEKRIHGSFDYDVVIVELGTDKPGDIAEFKDTLKPDIAVITAVSPEHMEFFGTLEAVAKEELSIASFSDKIVINADDVDQGFIESFVPANKPVVLFGSATDTNNFLFENNAVTITLGDDKKSITAQTQLIARQSIKSVVASAVVGHLLEMNIEQITTGIGKVTQPSGRMQLLKGIKNSTIIDDSYNASPLAVKAALSTLYAQHASQHIALLGNMNELGESSRQAHEEIGMLCDPKYLNLVVTLGKDANEYTATQAEAAGCTVIRANSPYEAGNVIANNLQEGAAILIKGSQNGVFSEESIKTLLANPDDAKKLVRQSDFWLAKKRAQFSDAP
ncbi:MAG: UDP-N-acetylmuramoyl-tripeptide--D-alanyl-D-alanine ligase [Candidatus Saccharimonadales bacterium]